MAGIFVMTVFVSIVAFTKSLETRVCELSTHSQKIEFKHPNNLESRCEGSIEIKYCKGYCRSSQVTLENDNHQVCSYERMAKRNKKFNGICHPDTLDTNGLRLWYYEPEGCRCSLCHDSNTSCEYGDRESQNEDLTLIHPKSELFLDNHSTDSYAGEKDRRGNPSRSKSRPSYFKYFEFVPLAGEKDRRGNAPRSKPQSSYPKYFEFVPLAGEKDRRGNPLRSGSQSSYPSYLGFIPSAELEDREENPSRSISQLSAPRYTVVIKSTGWNNRRRWASNFPPSPQYQVYYA